MRTLLIATIFLAAGCDSSERGCHQGTEDAQADMAGCPPGDPNYPADTSNPGYPSDAYMHTLTHTWGRDMNFYDYHVQCYDGEKGRLAAECAAQADTGL